MDEFVPPSKNDSEWPNMTNHDNDSEHLVYSAPSSWRSRHLLFFIFWTYFYHIDNPVWITTLLSPNTRQSLIGTCIDNRSSSHDHHICIQLNYVPNYQMHAFICLIRGATPQYSLWGYTERVHALFFLYPFEKFWSIF